LILSFEDCSTVAIDTDALETEKVLASKSERDKSMKDLEEGSSRPGSRKLAWIGIEVLEL
jgi:hypothetical protein